MTNSRQIDVSAIIEQHPRSSFQFWILVWSLALMFGEGYDMQTMAYAAPAIIREWHVSKQLFGPVLSASLLGYLAGALVVSVCSDYFGRKVIIVAAAFLFGILTLATAFATSLSELLALRFIAGIGLGAMVPAVIALNAEYVPAARRGTRISLLYVGYTSGTAVGGFLASQLIPHYGWPSLFVIGGVMPLVFGLVAAIALPESLRFLVARKAASSRIVALLRQASPGTDFNTADRFVLRDEGHAGVPVKLLFSDGRASMTILLWAAFIFSLLGHFFLMSWLPTVLTEGGLPVQDAEVAGAIFMTGSVFGTLLVGIVLDRKGIAALAVTYLLATPLIIGVGFTQSSETLMMVLIFLAGATLIGGQAGLNALSGILYPTFARSTGAGWALGVGRVGAIAGPTVGGLLLSAGMPTHLLFIWASLPAIACAGALFLILRGQAAAKRTDLPAALPSAFANRT